MNRDAECICRARPARSTDDEPPEPSRDRRCPVHGDLKYRDPDAARDERLSREWDEDDRLNPEWDKWDK